MDFDQFYLNKSFLNLNKFDISFTNKYKLLGAFFYFGNCGNISLQNLIFFENEIKGSMQKFF